MRIIPPTVANKAAGYTLNKQPKRGMVADVDGNPWFTNSFMAIKCDLVPNLPRAVGTYSAAGSGWSFDRDDAPNIGNLVRDAVAHDGAKVDVSDRPTVQTSLDKNGVPVIDRCQVGEDDGPNAWVTTAFYPLLVACNYVTIVDQLKPLVGYRDGEPVLLVMPARVS